MTPDELKALKPGDEVLVRVMVEERIDRDDELYLRLIRDERREADGGWAAASAIHSIAPPPPLAVGDRVHDGDNLGMTIIAIHGDQAWCDYEDACCTYDLADLRRIPAGA